MRKCTIIYSLLFFFITGNAQNAAETLTARANAEFTSPKQQTNSGVIPDKSATTSEEEKQKSTKNMSILWVPVLASNPASGFMFGVAPAITFVRGNPETTSISNYLGSAVYTTKKQLLLTFKGNLYFEGNEWIIMNDWRYFITSQPTYGLGTGPQSDKLVSTGIEYEDGFFSSGIDEAQLMKFNFLRLHQTAFKKIGDNSLYAGIGYHLDIHNKIEDQLLDTTVVPPSITSHYAYSKLRGINPEKYTLSSLSINGMYDTRDNTINPYGGRYALLTLKFNPEFLGSTVSSSSLWAEYRDYFNLNADRPRNLLAFWAYGNFQLGGDLPYLDLPALGWDQFGRSGRAYPQGRFCGQSLVYSELEWRFPLQREKDKWGGVLFANLSSATNKDADISMFKYINTGVGAGLRFLINKEKRQNLCLDYAWGNYGAHGFYLSVNEVF
ncbi:MAG: BamA/TamA family outer membrane protein [Mangrovibacterium sp.]